MYPIERHPQLDLANPIVDVATSTRQMNTVSAILKQFNTFPGVILADEVGMGKTFVALGVAVSVALSSEVDQPVVIMVPAGLMEKWPRDFESFREHCFGGNAPEIRTRSAYNVLQFLKLLDDEPHERAHIIFLKHGAINATRSDRWVKLAVMKRALHGRHRVDDVRHALNRFLPRLVHHGESLERKYPGMLVAMFQSSPSQWLRIAQRHGFEDMTDDPVPEAVLNRLFDELPSTAFGEVFEALKGIPQRKSKHLDSRLAALKGKVDELAQEIWSECARHIPENLPLLILDEAHHTKNARTRLASLFHERESEEEAGQLSRVFERMLFLTATPFQLGHHELCSILSRFDGIHWESQRPPQKSRVEYEAFVQSLHHALDQSQVVSRKLDDTWGRLGRDDWVVDDVRYDDEEGWWMALQNAHSKTTNQQNVLDAAAKAKEAKAVAEYKLQALVLRHTRDRLLANDVPRRIRHSGDLIRLEHGVPPPGDKAMKTTEGLAIEEASRLPFLLAARYAVRHQTKRAVFAEGLASSYHTFLRTNPEGVEVAEEWLDSDDAGPGDQVDESIGDWHLHNLCQVLEGRQFQSHPKLSETVNRVMALWERGEAVLVFCHFVQTGRDLRRQIAEAMELRIRQIGAKAFGCKQDEVEDKLEAIGQQFYRSSDQAESKHGDALFEVYRQQLMGAMSYLEELSEEEKMRFVEVTYRFLRTPSFLVRHFPLSVRARITESSLRDALRKTPRRYDSSGEDLGHLEDSPYSETLLDSLLAFVEFQAKKSVASNRAALLDALDKTQSGRIRVKADDGTTETYLPNVRLVNGSTKPVTRQSLMQTFNSPFFPEVLVASAVMSEGVDLHRNCRNVIHHDLCWSPSTLEQRTGRVDRIQSKGERLGASVSVYLPFLKATQDEKMYRVVTDRERWFNIVMGSEVAMDTASTERLAERFPVPQALVDDLAFNLRAGA